MGKQYGMMKRLIAGVLMFITAMGASATGQSGDMITIDGEKETRKAVSGLVQANMLDDAVFALKQFLK